MTHRRGYHWRWLGRRREVVDTHHILRCDCKTWELSYGSTDPTTLEEVREAVEAHMAECWRARHGRKLRVVR